jgi:hypothetical protein
LQHGLPYRTIPPGETVDWHSPTTGQTLNLDTSEVTIIKAAAPSSAALFDCSIVAIEALCPAPEDASPVASPPGAAALPTLPAKKVSEASLRECLLVIVDEHPDDPLDEDALLAEMERRLGAPVGRNRVRDARKEHAPLWVKPRGRPPKSAL